MPINELLRLAVQVIFILLGSITTMDYIRYRDQRRRDIALLFGSLATPFLTQVIMSIADVHPAWFRLIGSSALVAQPHLLLRLGRYFRPIPRPLMRITLIAMLVFWVALAVPSLFSQVTVRVGLLAIVLYFVVINGYMMWIFIRGALTTGGIVRQRFRFVAAGSGLLGLALGAIGGVTFLPVQKELFTSLALLAAIASAIAYYIGFTPPRWLRQAWQLAELRKFLLHSKQQSADQLTSIEQSLDALCSGAKLAVGGILTVVLQHNTANQQMVLRCATDIKQAELLKWEDGLSGQIGQGQTSQFIRLSDNPGEYDRRLLEALKADTLLRIPIITPQGVWGFLLVFFKYSPLFIEDDLEILNLLAWQTAITLEKDRMLAEVQQYSGQLEQKITEGVQLYQQAQTSLAGTTAYAQRLNLLNEMSQKVNTATLEDTIFKIVGAYIRRLLKVDQFSISLTQSDTDNLRVVLSDGNLQVMSAGEEIPRNGTLTGAVATTGHIKNIGDFSAHLSEIHPNFATTFNKAAFNSLLVVPIQVNQSTIGVITLTSVEFNAYDTQDENLLLHIASFLGIAIENTRRNQELEQAILLADKANRTKSEFLATMSHELRTPLNGILGYVQILQKDPDTTPNQHEGLNIIDRSGEHLLSLINDILDLSKIEANRMELNQSAFALTEMLGSVSDLIQVRAEQKGLIFRYEPLSELPVGVYGDEIRLQQVLLNLLVNAVKYTEQGGVILKIGYQGNRIRFQVEDTGIGIDAESIKTLFQPFQQASNRGAGLEGTGLGLAISNQFITLMGGQLSVKSQLSEGSIFWFDLDLPAIANFVNAPQLEERHIIGYKGDRQRIMIVDDRPENRAVLSGMLRPLGFEVQEAINGQDCLDKVEAFQPHMILMDLRMPMLNGLETMRRLRQVRQGSNWVVIAVSASAFDHDEQASRQAGASDFLSKPFRRQRLLHLIEHHLKLDWLIEDPIPSVPSTASKIFIAPSQAQLTHLFDLSRRGDIQEIIDQCEPLSQQGYSVFATALRTLAQEFQLKEMRQLIEQYRSYSNE